MRTLTLPLLLSCQPQPASAQPAELAVASPEVRAPSGPAGEGSWPPGFTDALLAERALEHPALAQAQEWLGTPYAWGGRGTRRNAGMDCLGLLYRAWGPVRGTPWSRFPVDPDPLVESGLLGTPVQGLAGTDREAVALTQLRPGDVLYLLDAWREIEDAPLWERTRSCEPGEEADANGLCTTPYWPWHTVLYVDQGVVVHAAPGATVRTQLLSELDYDALFVTRFQD